MAERRLRVGILGAGMIATAEYGILPNIAPLRDRVEVATIASRRPERAAAVARQFGIPTVHSDLDAMLLDGDLDAIVNLTPVAAHFETSLKILAAGKHLVLEKPLATTLAEADQLCAEAARRSLTVVVSPHEMLSPQWQWARDMVQQGAIGRPAFARVQSSHGGPALLGWPSDPAWFYAKGVGPLLDLGVYGLHRITGILGPAIRVTAFSGITANRRTVRNGPCHGKEIEVGEPDNTLLLVDFGNSTFASIDATYNVVATRSPLVELYGSEGTLIVNPPGTAPSQEIFRMEAAPGTPGWITPEVVGFPAENRFEKLQRAILIEHLADCLEQRCKPVASPEHARHVLEIMLAAKLSAESGQTVSLTTRF